MPLYSVDAAKSRVEFSLKSEPGSKGQRAAGAKEAADDQLKPVRLNDFKKGQKVKGFVRAITDFGVFVQIEDTEISGLAHKNEVSCDALHCAFHQQADSLVSHSSRTTSLPMP